MRYIFFALTLLFCSVYHSAAQTPQKCNVPDNTGGKYDLKFASYSVADNLKVLFITVKVKPNKFNREDLTRIARRIKETYCHDNNILAEIQDSSVKLPMLDDLMPPRPFGLATKWVYSIDRKKGEEELVFVNEKGEVDNSRKLIIAASNGSLTKEGWHDEVVTVWFSSPLHHLTNFPD
jgi:hypothetical protein